ncbi:MAG: DUF6279 family lipoprotein [Gammaproteobacteria bacterium]|nr:DUF6279 family lipoprotein [Gammaproteobacteria bacterium]
MHRYLLAAIVVGCLLPGCSATSLVYDNLPWLLRQRIDARFDLTSTQSSQLETHIAEFAAWHRRQELPHYAAEIARIEIALTDGLTRAEAEDFIRVFREARKRLLARAIITGAAFLHTVTDEQIAEFEATHREAIAEDRERLELPHDEQAELRFKRAINNLEDWFGDFDEAQSARIRDLMAALPDTYASWLQRREFRHRRFVTLLRKRPSRTQLEDNLREWWLSDTAALPREMRTSRELFWDSAVTFMLEVDAVLSEDQRAHAIRRLTGYRKDFIRLSKAQPGPARGSSES